jgi:DNA-binding response OmpR family regulator
MARTKILVADADITTLSRIYLALIHRNYKAEATDKEEEITERIKRFKPSLLILGLKEYLSVRDQCKIPVIVLTEQEGTKPALTIRDSTIDKPVPIDVLMKRIEEMI